MKQEADKVAGGRMPHGPQTTDPIAEGGAERSTHPEMSSRFSASPPARECMVANPSVQSRQMK
jgi:hypothetical protein